HVLGVAKLLKVVRADGALGFIFGLGQRRQEHGCQNSDNGDDDEQFDQGERWAVKLRCSSSLGGFGHSHKSSLILAETGLRFYNETLSLASVACKAKASTNYRRSSLISDFYTL